MHSKTQRSVLAALLATVFVAPAVAGEVTDERLVNADSEAGNWLLPFKNYGSHRFSALDEITPANVAGLHVAFAMPITTALNGRTTVQLQAPIFVDDGIMYFDDGAGTIYKVDVTAGDHANQIWTADAGVSKDTAAMTRGVALYGNNVYANLRDGRVVAVDRETGEFVWDLAVAKVPHEGDSGPDQIGVGAEAFTTAPLAAGGHLLVANGIGDGGTRGWLEALNPADGSSLWRTYVIPAPGEPGSETWKDDHNAWKTGGGGMWTTGSYDPEQKVTIWGTANPVPMFDPEYRPGDNLFTNSAIAFDIDSGDMKWYFQYTPNDSWDYDENGVHILYDAEIDGQMRKVVGHYGRNGFFYQLDRTNGAFINATQYVDKVTWTAGVDPKTGKPVEYDPALDIQAYVPGTRALRGETVDQIEFTCPQLTGGVRWQPPAYDARTHRAYSAGLDGCYKLPVTPTVGKGPEGGIDAAARGGLYGANFADTVHDGYYGSLTSVDVLTNTLVAHHPYKYEYLSGVLLTAGNVAFTATVDGYVTAHDQDTLEEIWRFSTGIAMKAPPIAYSVNGKEYIAILAGAPPSVNGGPFGAHPELANMQTGAMLYVFTL